MSVRNSPSAVSHAIRLGSLAAAAWTLVIGGVLWSDLRNNEARMNEMAHAEARANLNKDISFRRWATTHGGAYVPVTPTQQSVPWLSHVPGRDVTTTDGRELTLLNPASMLRQIMDRYADEYGIRGRITGLKYLNPGNAPDPWEKKQLETFERGTAKEVWEVADMDGQPYLRHLRAMYMEDGCDKCHAILGYKTGDFRGATGINLPLAPYYAQIEKDRRNHTLNYGLLWLVGLAGIAAATLAVRRRNEERDRAVHSLQLYANIFERSGEAIMVTDRDNRTVSVNAAFTRLNGYTLDDIQGQNPRMLASGRTPPETYQQMWAALQGAGFWQGELWDRRKNGEVFPKWAAISAIRDDAGQIDHYIASFTDISERKAAEERIDFLAHHDPLTRLPNRFSLEDRLGQALLSARREGERVAVMFIDLDRFKSINDTLGHHVGDLLLVEVASRLRMCVRESDIVARLGGDEFVVVLGALGAGLDAAPVAEKILRSLGEPYSIAGNLLHSSPSIGVATFPDDGDDSESLMKAADTAMYHAKEQGRNNVQFFTPVMNTAAIERVFLERELRTALQQGQLELHYQPKVRGDDATLCGVEALVRWRHPERGLIPPLQFIPIAEESGLIEPLGLWVLDEACRQLTAWRTEGFGGIHVAVNLSAQQLRSPGLVDAVAATMARHKVPAGMLEFEITESTAMNDPQQAIDQLRRLRELDIRLSIDDFGTGYSSLVYLKQLPIQMLKLDRTFVRDIETDSNDAAICTATLALAHSLGLEVVAEGVETAAQQTFLQKLGCDYLQGYLLGRPEPASVLSERWKTPV